MRRMLILVLTATAACASEARDDLAKVRLSEEELAYVEALEDAFSQSGEDLVSAENYGCLATSFVEVIGAEELQDHVTPAELRGDPEMTTRQWGIEPTEAQARDIVEAMGSCADLQHMFSEAIVGRLGDVLPVEDRECLERTLDDELLEETMVNGLVQEDGHTTLEIANSLYDWMDECIGMRDAVIELYSEEAESDAAADCLDHQLTDEVVRELLVSSMTGADDSGFDEVVESCS